MIFKTYENTLNGISNKLGLGKRSLAGWRTQVKTSFNEGTTCIEKFKNALQAIFIVQSSTNNDSWLRTDFGDIVSKNNIDSFIPKLDTDSARAELENLQNIQNKINETKGSWDDYNNQFQNGRKYLLDYAKSNDALEASVDNVKEANQVAREAAIAQNAALQQQTLGAKAATVATKALSVAGNMIVFTLISKGIELAVSAIDNYINRAKYAAEAMEEAQQKIDDAQNTLNNMSATISENKDRFLELSQGVDKFSKNLTLSEEDYAEYLSISNKLAAFSPNLVSAYDNQGNALLAIGSNAMETNEKLQSLLETQQIVAQQTLIDNMDDVANGIYYEVEDARNSIHEIEAELSSLQQQYNEFNIDISNSDGFISFNDEDYFKYGKAMEKALSSAGIKFRKNVPAGLYNTAIQLESASPQQLEQAQKFYDAWLASENEYYHASENGLKQDMAEKENFIDT